MSFENWLNERDESCLQPMYMEYLENTPGCDQLDFDSWVDQQKEALHRESRDECGRAEGKRWQAGNRYELRAAMREGK
jgi:hypothetical protein